MRMVESPRKRTRGRSGRRMGMGMGMAAAAADDDDAGTETVVSAALLASRVAHAKTQASSIRADSLKRRSEGLAIEEHCIRILNLFGPSISISSASPVIKGRAYRYRKQNGSASLKAQIPPKICRFDMEKKGLHTNK